MIREMLWGIIALVVLLLAAGLGYCTLRQHATGNMLAIRTPDRIAEGRQLGIARR